MHCLMIILGSLVGSSAMAMEQDQAAAERNEIEIVLRVSRELVEQLTDQEIGSTVPIEREMEGMKVRGEGSARGRTRLEFQPGKGRARFAIGVDGIVTAQFTADAGPITAHARSRGPFTSRIEFQFDEQGFSAGAPSTSPQTCTRFPHICSKRKRIIGRVVRCIGRRVISRKMPDINRAVDEASSEIINDEFRDSANQMLGELNQAAPYADTITSYFPEAKDEIIHLTTTETYLIAGTGKPEAQFPEFLIDSVSEKDASAQIELWIRTRPVEAMFIEMLDDWNVAHDLLKEYLPEDEAKAVAEDLSVKTRNGWTVIQLGRTGDRDDSNGNQ